MNTLKCIILIFTSTFLMLPLKAEEILVPIGRTVPLPINSKTSIHVSNGDILKLREFNHQVLATGIKEGEATLTVGKATFKVVVARDADIKSYKKIKASLKQMRGLTVSIQNGRAVVSGELLRNKDWENLYQLSLEENLRWIMSAKISEEDHSTLNKRIDGILSEASIPIPSISLQPHFQAIIPADQKNYKERYLKTLEPLGFKITEDKNALLLEPMVDLNVQMVELKKSSFRKLGISLPDSYSAQVLPSENYKVVGNTFEVALNAMEQDGSAKIIAEPHLSCRSGKEATFLAGGEFPIKIINFQTNDIQWKKHGILLSFKPLADRSGKLSLSLSVEISLLDQAQAVDGVPGLLVNRVQSHLDLKESQTIALSGLIKEQSGQSNQGIAALKNIPIIGLLFSSEDFRNDRTDLVIFVTPKVLTETSRQ